jgi:hypothetical protein
MQWSKRGPRFNNRHSEGTQICEKALTHRRYTASYHPNIIPNINNMRPEENVMLSCATIPAIRQAVAAVDVTLLSDASLWCDVSPCRQE